jgi:hypothetical protein
MRKVGTWAVWQQHAGQWGAVFVLLRKHAPCTHAVEAAAGIFPCDFGISAELMGQRMVPKWCLP